MKPRINLVERLVVYGLVGALFLVGLFLDLPITEGLYDPSNVFGQTFEMAAEIPAFALVIFTCFLGARFHPTPKAKWLDIALNVVFALAGLGVACYAGNHFLHLLDRVTHHEFPPAFFLLYALVYLSLSAPWVLFIKKEGKADAFVFAIFVLLLFATTLVVMQGLKMLWLRPRYRTLVALYGVDGAAANWLPVYAPQGFWNFDRYGVPPASVLESLGISEWGKEEFYSFPSGHTLHAVVPMAFCLASSFLPRLKGKEGYVRLGFYVWGILTAISRIVRGAHNLTDVAFGFLLGVLAFDLYSTFLLPALQRFHAKHFAPKETAPEA